MKTIDFDKAVAQLSTHMEEVAARFLKEVEAMDYDAADLTLDELTRTRDLLTATCNMRTGPASAVEEELEREIFGDDIPF